MSYTEGAITLTKKFWVEMLLVLVLTAALIFAVSVLSEPQSDEDMISPLFLAASIVLVLVPFFTSALGGFIAAGKTEKMREVFFIAVLPVMLIAIGSMLLVFLDFFTIADADWQEQADMFAAQMLLDTAPSIAELKAVSLFGVAPELLRALFAALGLAIAGAWVGAKLRGRMGGKR
ncbi:MAG: hypothetical protein V1676_04445 [Candidatus Diapherotrites archaeon]